MAKESLTGFMLGDAPATVEQLLEALAAHPEYKYLHQQLAPGGDSLFMVVEHRTTRHRYMLAFASTQGANLWQLIDAASMRFLL